MTTVIKQIPIVQTISDEYGQSNLDRYHTNYNYSQNQSVTSFKLRNDKRSICKLFTLIFLSLIIFAVIIIAIVAGTSILNQFYF